MSFEQIAAGLSSGEFIRFELIPSAQTIIGVGNQKIRLYRNDNTYLEAIVKYDSSTEEIFPPEPPSQFSPVQGEPQFNYLEVDPDALSEWRLGQFVLANSDEDTDMVKACSYQWSSGKTFLDLQTLNLMFVQGFLPASPNHLAPLDPETNLILPQINLMNRLDMITTNSQPHMIFPDYRDPRVIVHQYPFVVFVYPRFKANSLDELVQKYLDSALVVKYDFQTKQGTEIVFPDDRYLIDDQVLTSVDYLGEEMVERIPTWVDPESAPVELYELGTNFEPLVQNDLVAYAVNDLRPSNEIFSDLTALAKQLI